MQGSGGWVDGGGGEFGEGAADDWDLVSLGKD